MKNLKVARKLVFSFGTILALLGLVVLVAVSGLSSISGALGHFYNKPYQLTVNIDQITSQLQEVAKNMLHACVTTNPQETEKRLQMASDTLDSLSTPLAYVKQNYGGAQADVAAVEQGLHTVNSAFDAFHPLCLKNDITSAYQVYEAQILPELAAIDSSIQTMKGFEDQTALEAYQSGSSTGQLTRIIMDVIGVASLLYGIGMTVVITRGMTGPILELEEAANQMEQGNLRIEIGYQSRDELGNLADCMRNMSRRISDYMDAITQDFQQLADGDLNVEQREAFVGDFRPVQEAAQKLIGSLDDTLAQINLSADQVSAGSGQVASGSQALSQGTAEQASSVEELAATISEISSQVQTTAQNAVEASATTTRAGGEMAACDAQMQEMIQAMEEITEKSNKIGKIIKTIEDIAFQTNILALNASVEAARAGAAGKGFAVVADEVRALASKSAEASNSTAVLIEGSIHAVEKGTAIANDTASSLSHVAESAQAVAAAVEAIASAANQQASAIEQVSQGIDQISGVVQTNSATAQESAAASEELSAQAQVLKDLVGQFKLKARSGYGADLAQSCGI